MILIQGLYGAENFYLVDSGYPNRLGYLAPYKSTKYHVPEWRQGPAPRGKRSYLIMHILHLGMS
jgi:hypothetical protein